MKLSLEELKLLNRLLYQEQVDTIRDLNAGFECDNYMGYLLETRKKILQEIKNLQKKGKV